MRFAELADLITREIGADTADALIAVICRECAGESVYIPQRPGQPEIRPGDTPAVIARRHGVSRRTAYNWVTKHRR